jgi:hypothetical protein
VIRRLLAELRRTHSATAVEEALATLVLRVEGDTAIVTREDGSPLFGAATPRLAVVRIAPGVYTHTPTAAARVRLLEAASTIAPRVEVFAPTISDGTHRGRLAIDVPRRAARKIGLRAPEPGDRFAGAFVHAFFDDEAIVDEAARAGLHFVARRGAWAVLERNRHVAEERAQSFAREVVRALGLVRTAERLRLRAAPEAAVNAMRERGRDGPHRGAIGRARLRRAISWVDAAFVGGPNCFRRTLVEVGLDAGAADETLVFGLDVGHTGHVSFKDSEDRSFDVAFEVPPRRG